MKRLAICLFLVVALMLINQKAEADQAAELERIEQEYLDGLITVTECRKAKSNLFASDSTAPPGCRKDKKQITKGLSLKAKVKIIEQDYLDGLITKKECIYKKRIAITGNVNINTGSVKVESIEPPGCRKSKKLIAKEEAEEEAELKKMGQDERDQKKKEKELLLAQNTETSESYELKLKKIKMSTQNQEYKQIGKDIRGRVEGLEWINRFYAYTEEDKLKGLIEIFTFDNTGQRGEGIINQWFRGLTFKRDDERGCIETDKKIFFKVIDLQTSIACMSVRKIKHDELASPDFNQAQYVPFNRREGIIMKFINNQNLAVPEEMLRAEHYFYKAGKMNWILFSFDTDVNSEKHIKKFINHAAQNHQKFENQLKLKHSVRLAFGNILSDGSVIDTETKVVKKKKKTAKKQIAQTDSEGKPKNLFGICLTPYLPSSSWGIYFHKLLKGKSSSKMKKKLKCEALFVDKAASPELYYAILEKIETYHSKTMIRKSSFKKIKKEFGILGSTTEMAEIKSTGLKAKLETIEQMYLDGLLTGIECKKAKQKLYKSASNVPPGCRKLGLYKKVAEAETTEEPSEEAKKELEEVFESQQEKKKLEQKKAEAEERKKLAKLKIEEEKKRLEQKKAEAEEEKKKQELLLAQKKAEEELENQKLLESSKSKTRKTKSKEKKSDSKNLLEALAKNEVIEDSRKKIIRYECQQPWDLTTEDYRPLLDIYELDLKDRILKGTHRYITDKEYTEERIYPVLATDTDRVLVRYDSPNGNFSTKFFFNYGTDQSIVAADNSYKTQAKCVNRDYFVDVKIAKKNIDNVAISEENLKALEQAEKEAILAQKEIEEIENEQKKLLAKQNKILKDQKQKTETAKVTKIKVYDNPKKLSASLSSSISKSQFHKYNATSVVSYLFFESSENYLISLELLYRAYDLNTDADKIRSHIAYMKDSKSSENNRLQSTRKIVESQSTVIVNNIQDESLELSEQGKAYYAQSLPYALNAAIATYNLYHAASNTVKSVGQSGDIVFGLLNNLNNVIGIAQILPQLPAYSKNMYKTTKLIITGAKVKKIKDSGNVNKALDDLNLST